ncbi:helix-turn-helix domain-containing protein [Sphingobacterium psychroaquaticum]|uniref:Homeodomain-like domain-containing protein n=1 Tax=Sphingobacterium psychroaquaticum TaxID=561061 RepID=A0A1X7JW00_9SPHI|nr:helix-turn-helix domain-containing protein [Sphingobacterium psychroaquaticum]SMG32658.1 Homeodomain-like domain-containing protein [Sphingobacterium psychroaquaticum]
MSAYHYPIHIRAQAIESVTSGVSFVDVARFIGCSRETVSKWYADYRGYLGKEGIPVTMQSKINTESGDKQE